MRDFAKLKYQKLAQLAGNTLVGALRTYNFVSFWFWCGCAMGLMSAIGPEMTGVG